MPSTCRTKPALMRGLKPMFTTQQQAATTQKIIASACSRTCLYCDIWRLATLIASHSPLSARYDLATGTPTQSPISSAPSSPVSSPTWQSPTPYGSIIKACKRIEARFQTQRAQINSILSICTVAGADAVAGLRMAHDRCAQTIEDLLDQEEDLEEELIKDLQDQHYNHQYSYGSYYGYQTTSASYSHSHERRPSLVH